MVRHRARNYSDVEKKTWSPAMPEAKDGSQYGVAIGQIVLASLNVTGVFDGWGKVTWR